MIVVLGFVVFQYPVNARNIGGILVALAGIFYYTHLKLNSK